jgi:hypothetical protein
MRAFKPIGLVVRVIVVMVSELVVNILLLTLLLWIGFTFAFITIFSDRLSRPQGPNPASPRLFSPSPLRHMPLLTVVSLVCPARA